MSPNSHRISGHIHKFRCIKLLHLFFISSVSKKILPSLLIMHPPNGGLVLELDNSRMPSWILLLLFLYNSPNSLHFSDSHISLALMHSFFINSFIFLYFSRSFSIFASLRSCMMSRVSTVIHTLFLFFFFLGKVVKLCAILSFSAFYFLSMLSVRSISSCSCELTQEGGHACPYKFT